MRLTPFANRPCIFLMVSRIPGCAILCRTSCRYFILCFLSRLLRFAKLQIWIFFYQLLVEFADSCRLLVSNFSALQRCKYFMHALLDGSFGSKIQGSFKFVEIHIKVKLI